MKVDSVWNGGRVMYVDGRIVSQKIFIGISECMNYLGYTLEVMMKINGGRDLCPRAVVEVKSHLEIGKGDRLSY